MSDAGETARNVDESAPETPAGIEDDADPRICSRCGDTFYLGSKGGAFTSVSINHHGQPGVESYAESICESCAADLDAFMVGLGIDSVARDD